MKINARTYSAIAITVTSLNQAYAQDVPVTVNTQPCGLLKTINITKDALDLQTDTSCTTATVGGSFSAVNQTVTLEEYKSQTFDLDAGSTGGVGAIKVRGVTKSLLGLTPIATADNTVYSYTAPSVGTEGAVDNFYYLLEDSNSPPGTAVGKIVVNITNGTSSGGGGTCVDTAVITCMGPLDITANGTKFNQKFNEIGNIHVWQMDIQPGQGLNLTWVDADDITGTIASTPGLMTSDLVGICSRSGIETTLIAIETGAKSWECAVPAGTYYLNMRVDAESANNGIYLEYDLTWANR